MKSNTPKLNVRLLRRIQKHILEEPKRFEMEACVIRGKPGERVWTANEVIPACGTAACIAGWACILTDSNKTGDMINRARQLLGLSTSERVFYDSSWPEPFKTRYRNCETARGRARAGADRIEHLITTGE